MMRKALMPILIATLALSTLAFVAGCGGDANKDEAKKLMTSGDSYYTSFEQMKADLETLQGELAASVVSGDMSAVGGEAGEALQKQVADAIGGMKTDLEGAKEGFDSILALDGVQDYKDYASKMIEAVNVYMNWVDTTEALVEKLTQALAAMAQGQDIDILTLMMESEELTTLGELEKSADALVKEAEDMKKDKKLES